MKQPTLPKVRKFPAAKQRRLDDLLEKNREATISAEEKAVLEQLVHQAQELMVANAQRLVRFAADEAARPPAGAVPVTVWVQPHHAEP